MLVDLATDYANKEELIAAIRGGEIIMARDSKTNEVVADCTDVLMDIADYPNYHIWTAIITIKDGEIIDVK